MLNKKIIINKNVASNFKYFCTNDNVNRLKNLLKVMKKDPQSNEKNSKKTSNKPLVFKNLEAKKTLSNLWLQLEKEELELVSKKPPKNAFEEMINWTEEGKLWKFPIDNEQGLDEFKKEKFHEHVMFDDIIEKSPDKTSIKEFMNDVALGLSKNPHLTAERKRHYLEWYNSYFNENKELIDTLVENDKL